MFLERSVQVVDVGGMMLPVVDLHRLGVDVRLERVGSVQEEAEGNGPSNILLVGESLNRGWSFRREGPCNLTLETWLIWGFGDYWQIR